MTWLFGDSSRSPLEINYIEFLRLALDFSVEVLQAEERIGEGRERGYRLERDADAELAALEALGAAVTKTLEAARPAAESATSRCAAAIGRGAADAVRGEVSAVKGQLADESARIEAAVQRERERCVKALERLLLHYDLPETKTTLQLPTAGAVYAARPRGQTTFGPETLLDLEIPAANLFAHDVPVDRLIKGLEVKVPETGGWLRKQSRIVPHKMGRYRIAGVSSGGTDVKMELRLPNDAHTGFDIVIGGEAQSVQLSPVGKDAEQHLPYEPDVDDGAKLRQLFDRLAGALAELVHSRRALLDAQLDGGPLAAHAHPSMLVDRLIAAMTPTVKSIAQHSASPGELVLRRLLGGDRREEVFVSKGELAHKLEPLPPARRAVFEPLGFIGPAERSSHKPPPLPGIRPVTDPVDFSMVVEEEAVPPIRAMPTKPPGQI